MNDDNQIIIWLIGTIAGLVISYFLIYYATGVNSRKKQLRLQNQILLHIAKQLGVEKDKIDILKEFNDKL